MSTKPVTPAAKKTIGRPKLPVETKRVHFSCTVDPKTKDLFEQLRTPKKSLGQVLDDLAGTNDT